MFQTSIPTLLTAKTTPRQTMKQGKPFVITNMYDYTHKLTVDCKYTLVGKFSTTMPIVELINNSFIQHNLLSGGFNITKYHKEHVFIDLLNDLDYKKNFLTLLLESVGKVLYLDIVSIKRPRDRIVKVKMQKDLTKPRPRHVFMGYILRMTPLESGS